MSSRILLTGATGFVGSAVLRRLVAAGEAVRALVRPTSDRAHLDGLPAEVAVGDLLDPDSLARAMEGCAGLYHVAADYRLWTPEPRRVFQANVEGTRNVMLAALAAGIERVVYTSSVATLGTAPDGAAADEATPVDYAAMIGPYKQSKFRAEAEVRRLVETRGLPAVIVNPSTPVGPRDAKPTPTGRMVLEAARGRIPAYVDTGLNVVHVDDVAAGHLGAFAKGRIGERYVLGGEDLALRDILREIARITGRPAPRLRLSPALVMPIAYLAEAWARLAGGGEPLLTVDGLRMSRNRMFFSSEKARRELGYAFRPAAQALADAVAWFREHGYCG
jgi:dihydroflavonol-4-reductase